MWSVPHSGHVSVTVTVTDCWFLSLLHRPCTATTCKGTVPMPDHRRPQQPACHKSVKSRGFNVTQLCPCHQAHHSKA